MDDTPCYFDMTRDNTLAFKGSKNVDSFHTGGRKNRFTVCLAVSLDGRMIILRDLTKPPDSLKVSVTTSKSDSMDHTIAKC